MKRVLVIGIKGMAGHIIFKLLPKLGDYDVYGIARNIKTSDKTYNLDVFDSAKLNHILDLNFDIIINCVGVLNNEAESNPDKAIWFNGYFPHLLESFTKNTNTKVITISTDCVFSGKKGGYTETDLKDGEGFYAMSKSIGEIINKKDLTIRTSIVGPEINREGIGLFNWFMNQNEKIFGYSKAFWSGITTIELVRVIHYTILQDITGLIIVACNPKIDKYSLLKLFNQVFKNNSLNIVENTEYKTDKSMYSSRVDFNYSVPTYEQMIIEMKAWILANNTLYDYKLL